MANLYKIKEVALSKAIKLDDVAKELGITPQALYKMIRQNSTKIETLEKIAQILDVPIYTFFEDNHSKSVNVTARENSISIEGVGNNVNQQTDKFLFLLQKKDEQIDRLLNIIENIRK